MKKAYWENRTKNTKQARYGHFKMQVIYLQNCNVAQVSVYDLSCLRFPLVWSATLHDDLANDCLARFQKNGFFNMIDCSNV